MRRPAIVYALGIVFSEFDIGLKGDDLDLPDEYVKGPFPFVKGTADVGRDPKKVAEISKKFLQFGCNTARSFDDAFPIFGTQPYADIGDVMWEEQSRGRQDGERHGTKVTLDDYDDGNHDDVGQVFLAAAREEGRKKWPQTFGWADPPRPWDRRPPGKLLTRRFI